MCKLKSSQGDRPAAGDTVNELLFRCATFETKVNPDQSNYNIDRATTQVLNTERTGDFIAHGLSLGFYRYISDVSIEFTRLVYSAGQFYRGQKLLPSLLLLKVWAEFRGKKLEWT